MREIIKTPAIAKIIGCSRQQAHYNIRHGIWKFGHVYKSGKRRYCEATVSEIAKYLGITREEVMERMKEDD